MTERERLIELLNKKQDVGIVYNESQTDSIYSESKEISNNELADYLIEKGVIFKRCETCEYIRIHKMNGLITVLNGTPFNYCPDCGTKIE